MPGESIYNELLKYKKRNMSSFHTPGHKNVFLKGLFAGLDFTELEDTDDLYNPKGAILMTEKKASDIFGSSCTLISAGGCTLCIQAMLNVFCKRKSKILCSRVIHRSAVNAMVVLDLVPVFIEPKINKETGFYEQVTSNEIEFFLKKHQNIKAVYITSPDYYGNIANIKNISLVCKKYNVPLLVDNAHGSHLAFLKENIHPLFLGADATADSLHKTLPVLTGGALLHLKDKTLYKNAKYFMEFFGSSSPSFPIMASIDLCLDWLKKYGTKEFLKLTEKVELIKKLARSHGLLNSNFFGNNIKGFSNFGNLKEDISFKCKKVLAENKVNTFCGPGINCGDECSPLKDFDFNKDHILNYDFNPVFCSTDPTRICFNTNNLGITGIEVARIFKENKVEPEFYDENFIILIPSPFNTELDFYNLEKAIKSLPKKESFCFKSVTSDFKLPKAVCSLHEAVFERESIYVNTENAIGCIAAKAENICPPGIPIVIPGEEISKDIAKVLKKKKIKEVKVLK